MVGWLVAVSIAAAFSLLVSINDSFLNLSTSH